MSDRVLALLSSPEIWRFLRFVAVGVINTLFGYAVYAALVMAGVGPQLALLVATILGILFNFMTTGRLVFRDRGRQRFPRFVLAYLVLYALNALMLRGLIGLGWTPIPAQALLLPVMVLTTYVAMKVFVFRETTP